MHRKRSSSSLAAALTIPLLLCLPRTLVAALSINDYLRSSPGGFGSRGGGSLAKRNDSDFSQWGFYNPLDTGGYMVTVSLFSFAPSFPFPGERPLLDVASPLSGLSLRPMTDYPSFSFYFSRVFGVGFTLACG